MIVMTQEIQVEIRCESLVLQLDSQMNLGILDGYSKVYTKVSTHHILSYTSETSKRRIDVFAKMLCAQIAELWDDLTIFVIIEDRNQEELIKQQLYTATQGAFNRSN